MIVDLPALPEPDKDCLDWDGPYYHKDMSAYALAALAKRDTLFETQRKILESQRDELMRKCAERDAEIEGYRHWVTAIRIESAKQMERMREVEAQLREDDSPLVRRAMGVAPGQELGGKN